MIICHFTGRGISKASLQYLVLNEFDEESKFYKLFPVEERIRNIAKNNPNSYSIAIFDCNRELYDYTEMTSKLEANKHNNREEKK